MTGRSHSSCVDEAQSAPVFVSDLIDHYLVTELSEQTNWHLHSTRIVYRVFLNRWIRPRWGSTNIRDVRTDCGRVLVEAVATQRQRSPGEFQQSKDSQCHERAVQSRDSIRMARTRKESNKACAPEHASTTQSYSFRTARTPELTVTTGIALPTHGVAGRHHWIASISNARSSRVLSEAVRLLLREPQFPCLSLSRQNCGCGKRRLGTHVLTIGSLPVRDPREGSRSIRTW